MKCIGADERVVARVSPSVRRAWIEIAPSGGWRPTELVALREEGVD